nr:NADH dehydrogenase subunit 5 [Lysinibacillus timonensis]
MLNQLEISTLPIVYLILLGISVLNSLIILNPKTPLHLVRIHVGFLAFPPLLAFIALILNHERIVIGPMYFNSLSWLLAFFVLTIGFIVQRFCVHYLLGDTAYRKYFTLLTITTSAASIAWMSNDLRLLLVGWGATLLGLTLLIGLKKEWVVARNATKVCGRLFALSWGVLFIAIIWLAQATNEWQLSDALKTNSLAKLDGWETTIINLLLILAIVIPAAQWPFQRWLLDSVVAPTPISAIMHAGIVNAGGIILTLFAPLFEAHFVQMLLLIFSSISVLIGTGIMFVQVDYKRQLVGSTIAQMGFMFIQCALGAYLAAIIHAMLHGFFKSTLFLQSGSVFQQKADNFYMKVPVSRFWIIAGGIVGLLAGVAFWLTSHGEAYQLVSAFILGWSVALAWVQLVATGLGRNGRIAGFLFFIGGAIVYFIIQYFLHSVLSGTISTGIQSPTIVSILIILMFLLVSMFGFWSTRHRLSKLKAILYLWLVRLGEPQNKVIESHPTYLTKLFSHGGKIH